MTTRAHPFQKLCCVPRTPERPPVLLAAVGSSIVAFDTLKGDLLSQTPPLHEGPFEDEAADDYTNGSSTSKRRKLEHPNVVSFSQEESEESVEIVAERRKGERRKPKVEESKLPYVSHLVATSDGRTVIAVTSEDKCVNVFSLKKSGKLILRDRRSMPKRLCSIALTPDEQTIIVADKFGDVYSLPLNPSRHYTAPKPIPAPSNRTFQPSATELTVHTKGNLEALKQQREQKKFNARKEGPGFEHRLLLGHVSLLTDVAVVKAEVASKERHFILTSDRDEHIRVSRYPQAHVIHGYCLGFRDFVSKICIVPWAEDFLIAGTGEPSLKIFDWQRGQLISHFVFDDPVQEFIRTMLAQSRGERSIDKFAVSGIWPVHLDPIGKTSPKHPRLFIVALEGLPLLFSFRLDRRGQIEHHQTIPLNGNVLDVAVTFGETHRAIVSIDSIHAPGSMSKESTDEACEREVIVSLELLALENISDDGDADKSRLRWQRSKEGFELRNNNVAKLKDVPTAPETQAANSSRARGEYSTLGEFLYGLENLRKKRGLHLEDQDDSVAATEDVAAEEG